MTYLERMGRWGRPFRHLPLHHTRLLVVVGSSSHSSACVTIHTWMFHDGVCHWQMTMWQSSTVQRWYKAYKWPGRWGGSVACMIACNSSVQQLGVTSVSCECKRKELKKIPSMIECTRHRMGMFVEYHVMIVCMGFAWCMMPVSHHVFPFPSIASCIFATLSLVNSWSTKLRWAGHLLSSNRLCKYVFYKLRAKFRVIRALVYSSSPALHLLRQPWCYTKICINTGEDI